MITIKTKHILFSAIVFSLFLFCCEIQAATYYFDATLAADCDGASSHYDVFSRTCVPGSGARAWNDLYTINRMVAAGDTVYLRGGVSDYETVYIGNPGCRELNYPPYETCITNYSEAINPQASGTDADHRITYKTYQAEKVQFVGRASNSVGIDIKNKNWIKVSGYDGTTSNRNLKFKWFDGGFLWIWNGYNGGAGSDYNEISYCEFKEDNYRNYNNWQQNRNYSVGDVVVPQQKKNYRKYTVTTDNGSSGATEPNWNDNTYATTGDGDLEWTCSAAMGYRGATIYGNSQYNWVHHCIFSDYGFYSSYDGGTTFELGNQEEGHNDAEEPGTDTDNTAYNVIENNVFSHGGHHTIGIYHQYNVVRNNSFHNEQYWLDKATGVYHSYRNLMMAGDWEGQHGYNLVENNRISHGSENVNGSRGGAGISLDQSNNIIRYNDFYAGSSEAIYLQCDHGPTIDKEVCRTNHIYHNTFYANGHGATFPSIALPPNRDLHDRRPIIIVAGAYGEHFADYMYGNVIKNNIFRKNWGGAEGLEPIISATWQYQWDFSQCAGLAHYQTGVCGDTVITPNWLDAQGDPKFVSEGDYSNPHVNTTNVEWYWPSTPTGGDITAILTQPDFKLQSSSPVIDQAGHLTRAAGSGAGSTVLVVDDAKYFQPGWGNGAGGGAAVLADTICVETVNNCVQISSIDYRTNTITLSSPITWHNRAPIWLYKKSDGERVLYGSAPDYGAHEYASGSAGAKPPAAPGGLTIR